MTYRELKREISRAYAAPPSEKKAAFLKRFRWRRLNLLQLIWIQTGYMGAQLVFVLFYLLLLLAEAVACVDAQTVRVTAALLPFTVLVALTGLGRSERFGMSEIEAAARLSRRLLVTMRLTIIGIAGLFTVLAVSIVLQQMTGTGALLSFALAGTPYLLTSVLCMTLIRRWHSPKNIYGCAAIALSVCITMIVLPRSRGTSFRAALIALSSVCVIALLFETHGYIREIEELKWNLC